MNRNVAWVWGFVFSMVIVYLIIINFSLPGHLAVHFDAFGKPNGYQSREIFVATFFGFICLINGAFLTMSYLLNFLPEGLVNLPWKNYWFATPERKTQGYEKLRMVLGMGGIFVSSTFLVTEQIIYQSNNTNAFLVIPGTVALGSIFVLTAFFIALAIMVTKPPRADEKN